MVTTADSNWWVLTSANVDVSRCLDLGTVRVRVRARAWARARADTAVRARAIW